MPSPTGSATELTHLHHSSTAIDSSVRGSKKMAIATYVVSIFMMLSAFASLVITSVVFSSSLHSGAPKGSALQGRLIIVVSLMALSLGCIMFHKARKEVSALLEIDNSVNHFTVGSTEV